MEIRTMRQQYLSLIFFKTNFERYLFAANDFKVTVYATFKGWKSTSLLLLKVFYFKKTNNLSTTH